MFIAVEFAICIGIVQNPAHVRAVGIVGARRVFIRRTWLRHDANVSVEAVERRSGEVRLGPSYLRNSRVVLGLYAVPLGRGGLRLLLQGPDTLRSSVALRLPIPVVPVENGNEDDERPPLSSADRVADREGQQPHRQGERSHGDHAAILGTKGGQGFMNFSYSSQALCVGHAFRRSGHLRVAFRAARCNASRFEDARLGYAIRNAIWTGDRRCRNA